MNNKNEANALKITGKEQTGDIIKVKASKVYNEIFTNGFSEDGILRLIEMVISKETNEINYVEEISKIKSEILIETKKYIDLKLEEKTKFEEKEISKEKFYEFVLRDIKMSGIDLFVNSFMDIISIELNEEVFAKALPNIKILFDDWFETITRVKKEERKPNTQRGVTTIGGSFGKFEYLMIKYNISLEQKIKLIEWYDEIIDTINN